MYGANALVGIYNKFKDYINIINTILIDTDRGLNNLIIWSCPNPLYNSHLDFGRKIGMNLNNYLGCGRGGVTVGKCSEEERNIFKIIIGERDYLNNNRPKFKIKKRS